MTPFEQHIVQRFTTLYGAPTSVNPRAFVAEYEREFAGVRGDVLRKASDLLVRTQTFRTWPTVGECRKAIGSASHEVGRQNEIKAWGVTQDRMPPPPTAKQKARVDVLVAQFKAHVARLEEEGRSDLPPLPKSDRSAWEQRQAKLLAAGKFCVSRLLMREAA